jgi:hypothetical protein
MKDIVVILDVDGIPAAQELCANLADYEIYLFDPQLGDAVAGARLRNVQLFTALGGPSYDSMDHHAHAAILAWETELDGAQSEQAGISIVGWQHLNLYYQWMALQWYSGLWERMGPRFEQRRVHVLINDNPAEYYFPSFLPALLLACYLKGRGIRFTAYDYGAKGSLACRVPDLYGTAPYGPAGCLLTHLPTCFYDSDYFSREMRAAGYPLINLEARYWNVPITAERQVALTDVESILERSEPALRERIEAFTRALTDRMIALLTPHIALPNYCVRQARHVAGLYRSQLVTYFELQRYFQASAPAKLLLSEHDTGFHGPLITFAEQRSLPVILLPHSKAVGDVEFNYGNILVLTHPMQGQPIHNAHRGPVLNLPISYPERFTGTSAVSEGVRVISLMLNSLSLNGIPYAPIEAYLDGIKRIAHWCRTHDITLKIRSRPGYPIFALLRAYTGMDSAMLVRHVEESLDDHLRDCDLCLMYDMPTTGAMYCLRNSIPILNPVVSSPTTPFLAIVHPDVIATESLDATMQRLEGFRSDPLTLSSFRAGQFHAYVTLFQRARPLRSYVERPARDAIQDRWAAHA